MILEKNENFPSFAAQLYKCKEGDKAESRVLVENKTGTEINAIN
jgi:hypothetical protein